MRKVYYGWYVVVIAMVINAALSGSTFASFGVFVLPVSAELMLSRADMNTALILKNLGNAVLAPIIGRLLDRMSARLVMHVCAVIFALSFIILGLSHSLWLSALVMAVGVPVAYLGAGSLTNTLLIARWFTVHRGRAMLLGGLGLSIGAFIGAPAAGFLVESYGWRMALVIMGVAIGALLFALGLMVRERPGPKDIEVAEGPTVDLNRAERDRAATSPLKMIDLLQSPYFWTIALSTAISLGPNQALIVSLVPLGRETGLSMLQATSLMSVLGAAAVVAALSFSIIADRINRIMFLAGLFAVESLVNAALFVDNGFITLLVCAGIIGAIGGTLVHSFYALLADRFGTASFGTVRGTSFMLIGISGMIAVRYAGEVYDRTGGYNFMFATFIGTHLLAAILMLSTLIIRRPAAVANPGPTTS